MGMHVSQAFVERSIEAIWYIPETECGPGTATRPNHNGQMLTDVSQRSLSRG